MLLYLHGSDSYRRNEELRALLTKYRVKHPVAQIETFEMLEQSTLAAFASFLKTQSLFARDKLGIIEGIDTDLTELPALIRPFKDGKETTLIVAVDKALPKAYEFLATDAILVKSFEPLEGAGFLAFLKRGAALRNVKLSQTHTQKLVRAYEGDSWGLVRELDKLALGGTLHDSLALPDFFPLVQSLKNSSLPKRLYALTVLLEREEAAAVFNVFASLTSGGTKQKMADYDVAVKSGKLEYEEALTDLVISN